MPISIDNVHSSTVLFIALFVIVSVVSVRRIRTRDFFPPATTQELKGMAMLGVIFSHIGYFLVNDHQFLFPLTIFAGVCVNIFLFLSGFGLTVNGLRRPETRTRFYANRVLRLLIPFWLVFVLFGVADSVVLGITYPWHTLLLGWFGVFTTADVYRDLNSPLWYFTLILFYYLLFPLLFSKKRPWVTAGLLFGLSGTVVLLDPPFLAGVIGLYIVHIAAFPLGCIAGWLREDGRLARTSFVRSWDTILHGARRSMRTNAYYYGTLALLVLSIIYTSIHSGVGSDALTEQTVSILTMGAILLVFALKKVESRFLYLVGVYSYELYLLHWPLLYRYDFLYGRMPAWLATTLYLVLFLALGWVVRQVADRIFRALVRP